MKTNLKQFLDDAFKPYGNFPARADVEQELLANLEEKYDDYTADGKSDAEAYRLTTESFGDVTEIMEQVAHNAPKNPNERRTKIVDDSSRFRATSLVEADLAGTELSGSDFSMSALMGVNFANSDMQKATFKAASLKSASFIGTNLTDAVFSATDLQEADFTDANLSGAKLTKCALKGANFKGAVLDDTLFKQSDLSEMSFDNMMLKGTVFQSSSLKKATFKGAVLHTVSFHHTVVKHTNFDGATMDKITYALLKGAKAHLDNVTVK